MSILEGFICRVFIFEIHAIISEAIYVDTGFDRDSLLGLGWLLREFVDVEPGLVDSRQFVPLIGSGQADPGRDRSRGISVRKIWRAVGQDHHPTTLGDRFPGPVHLEPAAIRGEIEAEIPIHEVIQGQIYGVEPRFLVITKREPDPCGLLVQDRREPEVYRYFQTPADRMAVLIQAYRTSPGCVEGEVVDVGHHLFRMVPS